MEPIKENTFPFPILIINLDNQPERYNNVKQQLDNMQITNYKRFPAVNGANNIFDKKYITYNLTLTPNQAGCANSHVKVWEYIKDNNMGWTLVLEDDVNFHPNFKQLFYQYWNKVPADAKIIYPGYGHVDFIPNYQFPVIQKDVFCTHAYMINSKTAEYLLKQLGSLRLPIDVELMIHFGLVRGSYTFNDRVNMNGIVPYDYKMQNQSSCCYNGIIYQNQTLFKSTIK